MTAQFGSAAQPTGPVMDAPPELDKASTLPALQSPMPTRGLESMP